MSDAGALATAFQSCAWLRDWYATLGAQPGVWPVFVAVASAVNGADLLVLPLVAQRVAGITQLSTADLGVADYNWPLMAAGQPAALRDATTLWSALKPVLARRGDVLRLAKVLPELQAQAMNAGNPDPQTHPLLSALPAWPSESVGHHFDMHAGHTAWLNTLSRQARREFGRHWRLFSSKPGARFEHITDLPLAQRVLADMDRFQLQRMDGREDYRLAEPAYRQFYERRLANGLHDGSVVLTALRAADETVAVAYAFRQGDELTLVRVAFGDASWKPCAPGLLVMERTAHLMASLGVRRVDLSIGSYGYKRSFGCAMRPLLETCVALNWRGSAYATAWQTKRRLAG